MLLRLDPEEIRIELFKMMKSYYVEINNRSYIPLDKALDLTFEKFDRMVCYYKKIGIPLLRISPLRESIIFEGPPEIGKSPLFKQEAERRALLLGDEVTLITDLNLEYEEKQENVKIVQVENGSHFEVYKDFPNGKRLRIIDFNHPEAIKLAEEIRNNKIGLMSDLKYFIYKKLIGSSLTLEDIRLPLLDYLDYLHEVLPDSSLTPEYRHILEYNRSYMKEYKVLPTYTGIRDWALLTFYFPGLILIDELYLIKDKDALQHCLGLAKHFEIGQITTHYLVQTFLVVDPTVDTPSAEICKSYPVYARIFPIIPPQTS